ncbi:MAG: hypothetical protein J3R72DRAFT_471515 [Linnemannia gamsii]|nr:MAG: hypothetical protein J3R72DRAFT_471515 [Linnemannia gamsii]
MKLSIPILVVALAASVQALKIKYSASCTYGSGGTSVAEKFNALLTVGDGVKLRADREGGSSSWVKYGIHKIQLNNAQMTGFNYCINVFGNVDCNWIAVEQIVLECNYRPDSENLYCNSGYNNNNWGS